MMTKEGILTDVQTGNVRELESCDEGTRERKKGQERQSLGSICGIACFF